MVEVDPGRGDKGAIPPTCKNSHKKDRCRALRLIFHVSRPSPLRRFVDPLLYATHVCTPAHIEQLQKRKLKKKIFSRHTNVLSVLPIIHSSQPSNKYFSKMSKLLRLFRLFLIFLVDTYIWSYFGNTDFGFLVASLAFTDTVHMYSAQVNVIPRSTSGATPADHFGRPAAHEPSSSHNIAGRGDVAWTRNYHLRTN